MDYLYIVATNKEVLVTIRIAESVREEFKKAAELRGSTMSGLMHQFIIRTIREEKQMSPQAFTGRTLAPVVATISHGSESMTREEIERQLRSPQGMKVAPRASGSTIKSEINTTQHKRRAK